MKGYLLKTPFEAFLSLSLSSSVFSHDLYVRLS